MNKIVIAIVESNGRILMVRRAVKEGDLYWQFPGGQLEDGEKEAQAAEREVLEETGVKCIAVRNLGERIHPTTGRLIAYWLCISESNEIKMLDDPELDQIVWMTPKEVFNNVTSNIFDPVKEYLEAMQKE